MLAPNQVHVPHKTFGKQRIVQGGQENQQGTMSQSQADKGADLVIVGRGDLWLESIKGIAAGTEMSFPIPGANESFDLVGESEQPEEIALLFRGKSKDQRSRHETLEDGFRFGSAFCFLPPRLFRALKRPRR